MIAEFKRNLALQRHLEYEIVTEIPLDSDLQDTPALAISDSYTLRADELRQALSRNHPDAFITTEASLFDPGFEEIMQNLSEAGIEVEFRSTMFQNSRLHFESDSCSGSLRLRRHFQCSLLVQRAVKAALDFAIGLVGSAITLLIAPVIWLLLKREDGGTLFHHREYVGCDGETHYYLKFRTMIENADRELQQNPELKRQFARNYKLRHDPRVLRVGRLMRKFSIDEFPQFFSVLTGRLTFVGPRVISREELARQGSTLSKRFSVKPGMTGYWQVMGRQTTDYEERILMDMFYIDHWSIWLDIVIIGKTMVKFFAPEGAY